MQRLLVFFSFLTRFISSKSKQPILNDSGDNTSLKIFAIKEGGKFFHDFKLFHKETVSTIDILVFLPHFGIFIGEIIDWKASELENATVARYTRQSKHPSTTHLGDKESKIRSKLEDVLSFDFTPVYRFIWMRNLTENEFDELDSSFHELLPKSRMLFSDEEINSIKDKLHSLGECLTTPLSGIKIMGALQSFTFILPSPNNPAGALLSPQQNSFLSLPITQTTTLYGNYGTGKSSVLIRKAMVMLLNDPSEKILLLAPTLLASELLRNEFVSLMYHGALNIDLTRITFSHPIENFDSFKPFNDSTAIFCDDIHHMNLNFVDSLKQKYGKRTLLFTSIQENNHTECNIPFTYSYHKSITPNFFQCKEENIIAFLLSELRKCITEKDTKNILIIVYDSNLISLLKEAIDEYLGISSRILSLKFSLQTQDLDELIITTVDCISGIYAPHMFLLTNDSSQDYTYALSRASETATIITLLNS
jgi:hypothetical protein